MLQAQSSTSGSPYCFDVIVVGSGAAGLYAALCLPSHLQIGLITKDTVSKGASNWAQGGIAAAIAPTDTTQLHVEDTLQAGAGLCDADAVSFLVDQAQTAIDSLVDLGVAFDRHHGQLALTLEAAHSRPRVLHAADTTGRAIVSTLAAKVMGQPHIQIFEHSFALNLWTHPETGRCQGIRLLCQEQVRWLAARAVVLATGGGGQVFSQTTNPTVSTGDGIAMAWRAGAMVQDLEFFQFHPTALTVPGAPRFLISEAVRGEGAHLVDETGDRFTFQYHTLGELAPRDVVSRAIFHHLRNHHQVYLDLSPIAPQKIQARFPNIIQTCSNWGVDVLHQPIPVSPAAHYWMGGIVTDMASRTTVPGLYAIGECASTGVHGANRLASNSLLECLVFAAQLAHIDLPAWPTENSNSLEWSQNSLACPPQNWLEDGKNITEEWQAEVGVASQIRAQLPTLMWDSAGISRNQLTMETALIQLQRWRSRLGATAIGQFIINPSHIRPHVLSSSTTSRQIQLVVEALNLVDIATLILKSAVWRTESRGGHYRDDHPQRSSDWQVHTVIEGELVCSKAVTTDSHQPGVAIR